MTEQTAARNAIGRTQPWIWYVALSVVLLVAYLVATAAGVSGDTLLPVAVLVGIGGVLTGIRLNRPRSRWPWALLGAMVLVVIGNFFPPGVLTGGVHATPALSDGISLLSYAVGALTLVMIVRRRTPGWDLPGLIDAGVITVSAGLLCWIYLIDPVVGDDQAALAPRLVAAAYPLGDLMLATLGVRLLLDTGRKSVALYSLTAYLALTVLPDTMHTLDTFGGTTTWASTATFLWVADSLLLGLTGMHPSMRDMDAPSDTAAPDLGALRLTTLALASLLAPATLLVQYLRGESLQVPLICASCGVLFLLVIGRLAGLVAVQRRMAVTDGLTGLRTRRYFQDSLTAQTRSRHPDAAVVLLDVDHFKMVNDAYGHDAGDRVLREVANRLSHAVRPDDVAARYGGEEFAVLLPHTSPEDARVVADRIHAAVRDKPIPVGPDATITVTVSVGVACLPADVAEPDRLTLLADRLLYDAKDAGRDRVVAAH